jgi:hypothetical protein
VSLARTIFAAALILACIDNAAAQTQPAPLACDVGPLKKSYGGSEWGIYSCTDSRTVIFYSVAGSPAAPFYFMFFRDAQGLRLYGEGNGDKQATSRAAEELAKFSVEDVDALVEETRTIASAQGKAGAADRPGGAEQP